MTNQFSLVDHSQRGTQADCRTIRSTSKQGLRPTLLKSGLNKSHKLKMHEMQQKLWQSFAVNAVALTRNKINFFLQCSPCLFHDPRSVRSWFDEVEERSALERLDDEVIPGSKRSPRHLELIWKISELVSFDF